MNLFCSCHNKNKEKNNPNIQDMSVLVVLNFVNNLLNSQKKDQALMELDTALPSLDSLRERVPCIHICIRRGLVWGVRNGEISKWRPHPHSYVGAQNSFFIRTSLVPKSETQLWRGEGGQNMGLRRHKFKNGCNERSFIFNNPNSI